MGNDISVPCRNASAVIVDMNNAVENQDGASLSKPSFFVVCDFDETITVADTTGVILDLGLRHIAQESDQFKKFAAHSDTYFGQSCSEARCIANAYSSLIKRISTLLQLGLAPSRKH